MITGIVLALFTGSLVSLHNIFNDRMNVRAGLWVSALMVLALGFVCTLTIGLFIERSGMFDLQHMKVWHWFIGLIGVGVVVCMMQGIQRLGATYAISIVLASQLAFALLWDSLGWFGLKKVPFSFWQLLGVSIIVGGIVVFRLGGKR